jgi:hypothetical protein
MVRPYSRDLRERVDCAVTDNRASASSAISALMLR